MKIQCPICGKSVKEEGLEEHQANSKRCWRAKYAPLLDLPGSTMEIICLCGCGRKKTIRKADFKRGWGMFFSKSCKAKYQERCTGQYRAYSNGNGVSHAAKRRGENCSGLSNQKFDKIFEDIDPGWDAHKDCF
jgi:hypothetical protein